MRCLPLFFFAVMLFLHAYFLWNLHRLERPGSWLHAASACAAVLLGAFTLRRTAWMSRSPLLTVVTYYWIGFIIIACLFLAFRDVLAVAARAGDTLLDADVFRHFGARSVGIALLAGALAFAYSLYEAQRVRVRNVAVETDKLPPGAERLRLVLLTDVHVTPTTRTRTLTRIVLLANAQQPDIVLLAGDAVDGRFAPDGPEAAALRRLRTGLGKFAVVGNHDVYSGLSHSLAFLKGAGFEPLRNASAVRGGIRVVGVDDPQSPQRREIADVLREHHSDGFVLLLCHRPEMPAEAAGLFDLELAGHTHGGQIWPFGLAMRAYEGLPQGMSAHPAPPGRPRERSLLYISNGTRFWGPPVRFLTPPEITVVDLFPRKRGEGPTARKEE